MRYERWAQPERGNQARWAKPERETTHAPNTTAPYAHQRASRRQRAKGPAGARPEGGGGGPEPMTKAKHERLTPPPGPEPAQAPPPTSERSRAAGGPRCEAQTTERGWVGVAGATPRAKPGAHLAQTRRHRDPLGARLPGLRRFWRRRPLSCDAPGGARSHDTLWMRYRRRRLWRRRRLFFGGSCLGLR